MRSRRSTGSTSKRGLPLVHVLAGASRELAHGGLAAIERGGDLGEREPERLAEHEHGALQRRERLQDDEDGERNRLGEHGRLRGVGRGRPEVGDQRLRQPGTHVRLTPDLCLPQSVDGEAGGDADEIGARFAHLVAVGLGPAQPGVLDDVLGVRHTAQHAVGDPHQDRPVLFEDLSHGVGCHSSIPTDATVRVQAESVRR